MDTGSIKKQKERLFRGSFFMYSQRVERKLAIVRFNSQYLN